MAKPELWNDECQAYADEIIKDRLAREVSKLTKAQEEITALKEDTAIANEAAKTAKTQLDNVNKQLEKAGIDKDNLKAVLDTHKSDAEELTTLRNEKQNFARRDAFIKAGGKEEFFDKAIKLVDTEAADLDLEFKTLLEDGAFASFRSEAIKPDPNVGGNPDGEPKGNEVSKGMSELLFGKTN